jgi:hypothetical protein
MSLPGVVLLAAGCYVIGGFVGILGYSMLVLFKRKDK